MIVVLALLQAQPGKGDEVEKAFKELIPKVLKDPGTIAYKLNRNIEEPDKFCVYEKYESMDALKAHGQTEHFKAFGRATRELFAGRAQVSRYNEVA